MLKNIVKFSGIGLVIAAIGAGALLGVRYLRMQNDPEYRQMKEGKRIMSEWDRQYREDTYGGATPEETLRLFIEALRKGDTELAAKYFVPDEQEKMRSDLEKSKSFNGLDKIIQRIQLLRPVRQDGESVLFVITDEENTITYQASLRKNINSRWKIVDL